MASLEIGTKRSEQRPGRAMPGLTDKIRSNENPFATHLFPLLLLRFRSLDAIPLANSALSRSGTDSADSIRLARAGESRILAAFIQSAIVIWHFEWTEELLRSLLD